MDTEKTLVDYFDEFCAEFRKSFLEDQGRWGNSWRDYTREGQEERIMARFKDYLEQFIHAEVPFPWFKIAGYALVAWAREKENLD